MMTHSQPTQIWDGSRTGHSNPGCYLSFTNDCCSKLSKEHHMNAAILKRLPQDGQTSGYAWLKYGVKLSEKSLQSKIICKRHNSMLSPIDDCGKRLFDAIHARFHEKSDDPTTLEINGIDLERWLIQRTCALFFSNNCTVNGVETSPRTGYTFRKKLLDHLLTGWALRMPSGLMLIDPKKTPGKYLYYESFELCHPEEKSVIGGAHAFHNLTLAIFDASDWVTYAPIEHIRPRSIKITSLTPPLTINFSWPMSASIRLADLIVDENYFNKRR